MCVRESESVCVSVGESVCESEIVDVCACESVAASENSWSQFSACQCQRDVC